MTVSQKDIAEMLGISKVTVSRALNDSPLVAESMRKRVRELCERLEYYPHFGSRALHSRNVGAISVIRYSVHLSDIHSKWIYMLQLEAQARGYMLRLDAIDNFARMVSEHSADGFIVFDYTAKYHEKYPRLKQAHEQGTIPMVLIDCESRTHGMNRVAVDNHGAMAGLVSHLYDLGHRRMVFLGTDAHGVGLERFEAFRERMAALGLSPEDAMSVLVPDWAGDTDDTLELHEPLTKAIGQGATAVIGASDIFAIGAVKMLHRMGLRVPADVSVTGFDDSMLSRAFEPSLTTVRQRVEDVSRIAVDMLVRRITTGAPSDGELVGTELIQRETTGPRRM